MPNETSPLRRRFKFSLRTLLLVVTAAAIGSWAYWIGWPWWSAYREQSRFEAAARQLKVGDTSFGAMRQLPQSLGTSSTYTSSSQGNLIGLSNYIYRSAVYCVYFVYPKGYSGGMSECPCVSLQVFRLPPLPRIRNDANKSSTGNATADLRNQLGPFPGSDYTKDFLEFLAGNRKDAAGIRYELIYSDPPATP